MVLDADFLVTILVKNRLIIWKLAI